MANRARGLPAASFRRALEKKAKELGAKALLTSDPLEARLYAKKQAKVRHTIEMLDQLTRRRTAAGTETAAAGLPIETADVI